MAKTTGATLCFVEHFDCLEVHLLMAAYHHLGNTVAVTDLDLNVREIDENHPHLATIVSIDGAGAVEHGDALFEGQS